MTLLINQNLPLQILVDTAKDELVLDNFIIDFTKVQY